MAIKLWFGNVLQQLHETAYRNFIRELIDGGTTYEEAIKSANRIFTNERRSGLEEAVCKMSILSLLKGVENETVFQ